ncbi:hypothetical protein [Ahrensia sp. R2A130]|uniref:hypothetical protein n=1 Tax=Ahrensia sp. R2A130 TaxID=744979 RepID=UPI0012EA85C1|nr:hypothetical protein [Ahrensia sp. R2A130]
MTNKTPPVFIEIHGQGSVIGKSLVTDFVYMALADRLGHPTIIHVEADRELQVYREMEKRIRTEEFVYFSDALGEAVGGRCQTN